MPLCFETQLYRRLRDQLDQVRMIDTHEHLQRESELPQGDGIHIGRFFTQYTDSELITVGMSREDLLKVISGMHWWWGDTPDLGLSNMDRWRLVKPWYAKAWNTTYFESLRIAIRGLYGVDDFTDETMEPLLAAMRRKIKPGFTREVFDKSGIDFAMTNPFGPMEVFNDDYDFDCFIPDMTDGFTGLNIAKLTAESGREIRHLDDYLGLIDHYFDRDANAAGAFKIFRAYDRPLSFADVPREDAGRIFDAVLAAGDNPGRRPNRPQIQALEDFLIHTLCRKCGEYGLRMKFHTGVHSGNGNYITNSQAVMLTNLFMKYPKTLFDIYHISYPYQHEALILTKYFPNVTIDFCFAWLIDPAGSRQFLAQLLDAVPASKIHGFGGDYWFVEGVYGHAEIARREITRVLAQKIEEGRFDEDRARSIGQMLLRDNALENFDLAKRRAAFGARKIRMVSPD